jgi:hypothetical protein
MESFTFNPWIYYFQVYWIEVEKNSYLTARIDIIELGDNEIFDREILDGSELSKKYIKKVD